MNPNDIIAGQNAWIDNVDIGGGKKGFTRTVTYADGRKVLEVYEYGVEGGPIREEDAGKDPKAQADYAKWVKDNTPVRTDVKYNPPAGQPGHDPSLAPGAAIKTATPEGGSPRVIGTEAPSPKEATDKPKVITSKHDDTTGVTSVLTEQPDGTRKWETIKGGPTEAPSPGTQDAAELLRQKQENQKNGKGYKTNAEVERDTQATTKETETKRNTWKPVGQESIKNEVTGVTEVVTMEENGLGERRPVTNRSTVIPKPEPPKLIPLPNGKQGRLIPDPNTESGYRVVPIEGTGATGSQAPDISDTNAQYGQIADTLRQKAVQLAERAKARIAAGEDSATVMADYTRDLTTERELQQAKINEIGSIAQEQRLIQTGERGEGQSRRAFASTASTNAINTLSKLPQTGREFFESVRNLQGMQKQFAESIPGTFPDVSRTPLQKSIMSMGMDGKITIDPTALVGGGAPGAGGAQPPDLSTIGADFGVAQPSGNGLPGPGAGVGPMGENLTRPGFSEGMTPPPFESLYDPEELLEGTGFEGTGSSALQSLGLA